MKAGLTTYAAGVWARPKVHYGLTCVQICRAKGWFCGKTSEFARAKKYDGHLVLKKCKHFSDWVGKVWIYLVLIKHISGL